MPFRPKYDYDDQAFYKAISLAAANGMTDAEIADTLELSPECFCRMKNGKYDGWSSEKNRERSERICQCLARARRKVNALVRGRYLKAAIGGIKVKSVSFRAITQKCERCGGTDPECEICGGTGIQYLTTKSAVVETEQETPPNMQALSKWLYHHDQEWRKVERNMDEDAEDVPTNIEHGIDIDKWIEKEIGL